MLQEICLTKLCTLSLIMFWNLQEVMEEFLNHDIALEGSNSMENGLEIAHQEPTAIRRSFLMAKISVIMAKSKQTFL